MMSSSEVQRITLSATKIVSPNGGIDLEEWEDESDTASEKMNDDNAKVEEDDSAVGMTTTISAATSENAVNTKGVLLIKHEVLSVINFKFNCDFVFR